MRLAKYLTDYLYIEGIISDEDKTVICFGLESLAGNLSGAAMALLVGCFFKHAEDAFLLWLLLFPLRKNAGGYHAATRIRCLLISSAMLITAFIIFIKLKCTFAFYGISAMVFGSIIWILAPVDNSSKMLDATEYNVYGKRSKIILVAECTIITLSLYLKWTTVVRSGCMALFITSMSLLMGILKNHSKKGYS